MNSLVFDQFSENPRGPLERYLRSFVAVAVRKECALLAKAWERKRDEPTRLLSQTKVASLLQVRPETVAYAVKLPEDHPLYLPSVQGSKRGGIGGPTRLITESDAMAWKRSGKDAEAAEALKQERSGKLKVA